MRVLIAEDESQTAQSLKKSLQAEGYDTAIASDGSEALELLANNTFDILLLDWRMPKLSGLEVCRKVRANGNDIPIILITALSDISNKTEALNFGADDYITKPFSIEELLARIKAVSRRYHTHTTTIHLGEIELDLINRTIKSSSGEVKLPEKEFELLRYFIRNKNLILSKEQLARDVWQYSRYPLTNFVEATVKNLRKKLEEISPKKFIKNIYGEGYIFISD
ncbi:MAG: response regulator transcription factor [Calditrichia bacterium]